MDNISRLRQCNICNKKFSSYKSIWNHNKKFHNCDDNITQTNNEIIQTKDNNQSIDSLICKFCKKVLSHRNSRWRHEKTCKNKSQIIIIDKNEYNNLQNKNINFEEKINKLENQINNNIETKIIPINNHLIDIISNKNKKIEE